MPQYDYLFLLDSSHVTVGKNATYNATNDRSTNYIDFGIVSTATSVLSLQYPGIAKGDKFGAHVVVVCGFVGATNGIDVSIVTGSSTSPNTNISTRRIPLASLVKNAHFFIPCAPEQLLQYAALKYMPVSGNTSTGTVTAWFGPGSDGGV